MKSPWPTKKLGEICEENKKSSFKVEDADNIGNFPFFTSGGKILNHSQYLVDGENIFLSTGGYAHVKYYKGKASYSADTWSLKVKNALTKYVYYQILEKIKWIDTILFKGTGLRHLQKKEFLNLKIPLPPLPIQQKIVSILDTIQEAIEIQNKIIEKTKELKKSMMADLFKYGLPAPRETFYVYIIRCENDSFYIGHTSDIHKRWLEHQQGKVNWTKRHKPIEIIHYEEYKTREDAVKREKELKTGFGRKWIKREFKAGRLRKWDERAARQVGGPSFRQGRKLKKTEIGEIPEDWEVVRLGDENLFEIKLGGTPKTSISEYWNGEVPWITPNDLSNQTFPYIEKTQRSISKEGLRRGSTLLPAGSIILSTRAPIGYVGVLKRPMAFNQGCKGITIKNQEAVLNLFLYYFLLTKSKLLHELGSGSTFRELATHDLESFKIPLPPLPEQREIADILQTIDQKIEIEQKKKELYEELFKTMLNKIFTGEIDVEKINI